MSNLNLKSFRKNTGKAFSFLLVLFLSGSQTIAQNRTIPGEVTTPYPTIINLAIEWYIQGDDNQNGIVSVQFREKGKMPFAFNHRRIE